MSNRKVLVSLPLVCVASTYVQPLFVIFHVPLISDIGFGAPGKLAQVVMAVALPSQLPVLSVVPFKIASTVLLL